MAFEVSRTAYQQMLPQTAYGYPYENKYHNMGQLQTPYQGRLGGVGGDYGVPQNTVYYTPKNPTYPYVLDKDFRATQYLPTEGCIPGFVCPGYFPAFEGEYPDVFVKPNYYSPSVDFSFKNRRVTYESPKITITRSPVGPREEVTVKQPGMEKFDYVKLKNTYHGIGGNKGFVH